MTGAVLPLLCCVVSVSGQVNSITPPTKEAAPESPRIALLNFISDDMSIEEAKITSDLHRKLYAMLTANRAYRWIELPPPGDAWVESYANLELDQRLRMGRASGATIIITGQFNLDDQKRWNRLDTKLIDVRTGEVLGESSYRLLMNDKFASALLMFNLDTLASALLADLAKGLKRMDAAGDWMTVAPLVFENRTEHSRRLDGIETALFESFGQVDANKPHVLQLPWHGAPHENPRLSFSGLADANPRAATQVADVYVWGWYEELEGAGRELSTVHVKMNVRVAGLWGEVVEFEKTGRGDQLQELTHATREEVMRIAAKMKRGAPTLESTQKIAEEFYDRAQALRQPGLLQSSNASDAWLARWRVACRLYELAYFFDPSQETYHLEMMAERFREDITRNNRRFLMKALPGIQRLNEIMTRHVDRFGLDHNWLKNNPRPDGRGTITNNRLPHYSLAAAYVLCQVDELRRVVNDAKREGLSESGQVWLGEEMTDLIGRLERVSKESPETLDRFAFVVLRLSISYNWLLQPQHIEKVARIMELLWPHLAKAQPAVAVVNHHKRITSIFKRLGDEDRAVRILGPQPELADDPTQAPKLSQHVDLAMIEKVAPPRIEVAHTRVPFINDVRAMASTSRYVWISSSLRDSGPGEIYLWAKGSGELRSGKNLFPQHDIVGGFEQVGDELIIAASKPGAFKIHLENAKVSSLAQAGGLGAKDFACSARIGKAVYLAERGPSTRMIEYDSSTGAFAAIDLKEKLSAIGVDTAEFSIHKIEASGQWLLMHSLHRLKGAVIVYDTQTGACLDLNERVDKEGRSGRVPEREVEAHLRSASLQRGHRQHLLTTYGDASGFWIGLTTGMLFYDPATDHMEWFASQVSNVKPPPASLMGPVEALCSDDRNLYVATYVSQDRDPMGMGPRLGSFIYVMDKATRVFIGRIESPIGSISTLAVDDDSIYCGARRTMLAASGPTNLCLITKPTFSEARRANGGVQEEGQP